MALQFRKGTAADRDAATTVPLPGEPWFTIDDGQLYVGDGITPGGLKIGANINLDNLTNVETIQEQAVEIGTYTIDSNAVIIATTAAHSFYTGLTITISGSPVTELNGTHTIIDATPGTTAFVFALTSDDVATTSTTGTITAQIPNGSALVWNQANSRWQEGKPEMTIDNLTDVDVSATLPVNGQYLGWDETNTVWRPTSISLGLFNLVDVDTITNFPTSGQYLTWNDTNFLWEPTTLSLGLFDLADVDIDLIANPPTDGQYLTWDDTSVAWKPTTLSISLGLNDLTDVDTATTAPTDGQYLTWDGVGLNWKPTTLSVSLGLDDLTDVDLVTTAPTGGDLLVYNGTSNNFEPATIAIDDLSDVDTFTTTPSDGDVLTWNSSNSSWQPAATAETGSNVLHTTFLYEKGTAFTGQINGTNAIGKNWGTWREQTAANVSLNFTGPADAAFDPTLSGITFNSTNGEFLNIPQGRYLIKVNCEILINNVTPFFYTSPPALFMAPLGTSITSGSFYSPGPNKIGILPYASYGSAQHVINYTSSVIYVADDVSSSTNIVQIALDQDQGPAFYVERASIDFIRLDG